MVSKKVLTILISMLALTMTSITLVSVTGGSLVEICVDPSRVSSATLTPGQKFSVNITVANVSNLRGYDIKLGYDTTILNGLGVEVSPFENLPSAQWQINDAGGYVWINVTYEQLLSTVGFVTVATIKFQVQGFGESVLHLYDTKLVDETGGLVSHLTSDGFFQNAIVGDIDHDGDVDILDVATAAKAWGSKEGDSNWNPIVDLVPPYGLIDIFDLVIIAKNYGKKL